MRLSKDPYCRVARLLFILLMAMAWCGAGRPAVAQSPGAQPPAPKAGDLARYQSDVNKGASLVQQAQQAAASPPTTAAPANASA